jgi:hypothetical protein
MNAEMFLYAEHGEWGKQPFVTTFVQLIPLLIEAEKTDLITRQDTDIGFKFVASQLFDPKLLPEGKYP